MCIRNWLPFSASRIAVVATLLSTGIGGCGPSKAEIDLQKQNNALRVRLIQDNERMAKRDAKIASLESRLDNLRTKGLAPPEPIFDITSIQVLGITGGVDLDGKPGDDGVAVYFRPVDADGDTLKRGGEIRVRLTDNAVSGQPRVLSQAYMNAPEKIRQAWYGKFWTNHYKIVVPFAPDARLRPGQEVDVYVRFMDYLTGREFTGRKMIKLRRVEPD